MSDRELVLEAVRGMPENLTLREILDELQLMETLRERLAKNPEGRGASADELLKQLPSWITK